MNKLQELYEAKIKILSEDKDQNVMNIMVPFIQAGVKNQNGRIYPKSLLQREISRVRESVKRGSFIGTGDHPSSGLADIKTASHIVTSLTLDEKGQGIAELRILPTERGKTIQTLIRNNATLGVSIRGFGSVNDKTGEVMNDYKLAGLDVVMNPSFKSAVFDKSNIFESVNFEEDAAQKQISALDKEAYLGACDMGFHGTQDEFEALLGRKTSDQKLTEGQISARTHMYFMEACSAGFVGSYEEWQKKFPKLVEQAKEKKVVVEKKEEPKASFESKTTWDEVIASGFHGTQDEWKEKFPNIEVIKPETQKPIVERTLEQEAAIIFTALSKDNPNSQITLEDVKKMLEKEEIVKADKRLRERAIYIVNASLAGSGSYPSQEMLEKMVAEEIERLTEERKLRREKNWQIYKKLLSE